ncbi:VWA domain-containing protein [Streptomyces sp. NPDC056039]|uniref:VWA domain-containing protein n=1 Tax=Streptomyces sp. NPDC056039 TaxID=3345687 RepID=UPI0035E1D250
MAEKPAAVEEPAAVEKPAIVEEPAAVEKPTVAEEPAVAEKPAAVEEPEGTEKPAVAEEPEDAGEPVAAQAAEKDAVVEEPTVAEKPVAAEVAEGTAVTEEPAVAEEPAAADEAEAATPPAAEPEAAPEEAKPEKPESQDTASTEAAPQTEPETVADTQTPAEPEPTTAQPKPEAKPKAEAEAPAQPKAQPEAEAKADAPAPADGDSAPQGPPAPDNESSTGGAGGNNSAEGEAEADTDTDTAPEPEGDTTPALPLTRVKSAAPGLTTAYKAATTTLKTHNLTGTRAKVYLVLDRSASMRPYYKDGSAQALAEQTLALATHLDPEATVQVVFFSTELDGTGEITLTDHENKIDTLHAGLGRMGRTSYHAAVEAVLAHHSKEATTTPALVIFQTDGAPDAKTPATKALTDAAKSHPTVFFSFVAFGDPENKAFDYLRKLKAPNTSHFLAGETPRELTDKELYEGVLANWRP